MQKPEFHCGTRLSVAWLGSRNAYWASKGNSKALR